jgi:hypothetical protein
MPRIETIEPAPSRRVNIDVDVLALRVPTAETHYDLRRWHWSLLGRRLFTVGHDRAVSRPSASLPRNGGCRALVELTCLLISRITVLLGPFFTYQHDC